MFLITDTFCFKVSVIAISISIHHHRETLHFMWGVFLWLDCCFLNQRRSLGSQEQKMFGKHFLPRAIAAVRRQLAGRQLSRRYRWLVRSAVIERGARNLRSKKSPSEPTTWSLFFMKRLFLLSKFVLAVLFVVRFFVFWGGYVVLAFVRYFDVIFYYLCLDLFGCAFCVFSVS